MKLLLPCVLLANFVSICSPASLSTELETHPYEKEHEKNGASENDFAIASENYESIDSSHKNKMNNKTPIRFKNQLEEILELVNEHNKQHKNSVIINIKQSHQNPYEFEIVYLKDKENQDDDDDDNDDDENNSSKQKQNVIKIIYPQADKDVSEKINLTNNEYLQNQYGKNNYNGVLEPQSYEKENNQGVRIYSESKIDDDLEDFLRKLLSENESDGLKTNRQIIFDLNEKRTTENNNKNDLSNFDVDLDDFLRIAMNDIQKYNMANQGNHQIKNSQGIQKNTKEEKSDNDLQRTHVVSKLDHEVDIILTTIASENKNDTSNLAYGYKGSDGDLSIITIPGRNENDFEKNHFDNRDNSNTKQDKNGAASKSQIISVLKADHDLSDHLQKIPNEKDQSKIYNQIITDYSENGSSNVGKKDNTDTELHQTIGISELDIDLNEILKTYPNKKRNENSLDIEENISNQKEGTKPLISNLNENDHDTNDFLRKLDIENELDSERMNHYVINNFNDQEFSENRKEGTSKNDGEETILLSKLDPSIDVFKTKVPGKNENYFAKEDSQTLNLIQFDSNDRTTSNSIEKAKKNNDFDQTNGISKLNDEILTPTSENGKQTSRNHFDTEEDLSNGKPENSEQNELITSLKDTDDIDGFLKILNTEEGINERVNYYATDIFNDRDFPGNRTEGKYKTDDDLSKFKLDIDVFETSIPDEIDDSYDSPKTKELIKLNYNDQTLVNERKMEKNKNDINETKKISKFYFDPDDILTTLPIENRKNNSTNSFIAETDLSNKNPGYFEKNKLFIESEIDNNFDNFLHKLDIEDEGDSQKVNHHARIDLDDPGFSESTDERKSENNADRTVAVPKLDLDVNVFEKIIPNESKKHESNYKSNIRNLKKKLNDQALLSNEKENGYSDVDERISISKMNIENYLDNVLRTHPSGNRKETETNKFDIEKGFSNKKPGKSEKNYLLANLNIDNDLDNLSNENKNYEISTKNNSPDGYHERNELPQLLLSRYDDGVNDLSQTLSMKKDNYDLDILMTNLPSRNNNDGLSNDQKLNIGYYNQGGAVNIRKDKNYVYDRLQKPDSISNLEISSKRTTGRLNQPTPVFNDHSNRNKQHENNEENKYISYKVHEDSEELPVTFPPFKNHIENELEYEERNKKRKEDDNINNLSPKTYSYVHKSPYSPNVGVSVLRERVLEIYYYPLELFDLIPSASQD